ncbi:unnamed protein product, partial [Durusdinium trenchii]
FDPPPPIPSWPVVTRGHHQLALEAALQSTVLLKNDGRLPLQRGLRLAVLGPLRNATEELLGNYQAWPVDVVSPLEGLKEVDDWGRRKTGRGAQTWGEDGTRKRYRM